MNDPALHRESVAAHRARTGNKAGKEYNRARGRALTRLSWEYAWRFDQLLSAELDKERADG